MVYNLKGKSITEPNQSELKLKGCPFCATEPILSIGSDDREELRCEKCLIYDFPMGDWNTRPIEDELRQENERLRKDISAVKADAESWAKQSDRFATELLAEQNKVKLLREALELANEMSGPRAHRLGCDCGGHNGDGKSCHFLMTKIKEALASTEPNVGDMKKTPLSKCCYEPTVEHTANGKVDYMVCTKCGKEIEPVVKDSLTVEEGQE